MVSVSPVSGSQGTSAMTAIATATPRIYDAAEWGGHPPTLLPCFATGSRGTGDRVSLVVRCHHHGVVDPQPGPGHPRGRRVPPSA